MASLNQYYQRYATLKQNGNYSFPNPILDLFIINKKKILFFLQQELLQLCCQPRSTSSSEALQPSSYIAAILKKKTTNFFIHFKICTIKAFSDIKKTVFLLKKISKKAPMFQPATVVSTLNYF